MAENRGKQFEKIVDKGLAAFTWHKRLKDRQSGFKTDAEPCDFLAFDAVSGTLYALECKASQQKRFDFSCLTDMQFEGLCEFDNTDRMGGYVLFWIVPLQRVFLIDIYGVVVGKASGLKSFNLAELESNNYVIEVPVTKKQILVEIEPDILQMLIVYGD